ncbi:hypothetical protein HW49_05695 [Porphyromonadaceae bacterium COT-184 OH4590]|nr:hypothetical protein HW49_05695 [Porphyromonadaceae bacterium COT-184 OH4590]
MIMLKKIKAELDQKIEKDTKDNNQNLVENFSLKSILDGRILLHKGFRRLLPMIVFLFGISLVYINNRFTYEALVMKNNELKEEKTDLQTTGLVKIRQYKEVSTRSAVIEKLSEMGSNITEPQSPPIVIDK